jgi:hypothetical protein
MGQELNITSYIAAQGVGGSCAMLGLHRETEAATAEIKTACRRIIAGLVLPACATTREPQKKLEGNGEMILQSKNSNSIQKEIQMAFQTDEDNMRVFDPVTQLEMIKEGGGSDGSMDFVIRGDKGAYHFSTHMEIRDSTEYEKSISGGKKRTVVWLVHNGRPQMFDYTETETKKIIQEAMLSYENLFRTVERVAHTSIEFFGEQQ